MSEATEGERPGAWVEGIGWVALIDTLPAGTSVARAAKSQGVPIDLVIHTEGWFPLRPVIVTRWPDGTEPEPPVAAVRADQQGPPSVEQLAEWLRTDGRDGLRRHVYTFEHLGESYTNDDGTTGDYPDAAIEDYRDGQCDHLARKLHALMAAAPSGANQQEPDAS